MTPNLLSFIINQTFVMANGEQVAFSCQHCEARRIIWKINGTDFTQDITNGRITLDYQILPYCGPIHMLTMRADTAFNNTDIICKAAFYQSEYQESLPVKVYIQGIVDCTWSDSTIIILLLLQIQVATYWDYFHS